MRLTRPRVVGVVVVALLGAVVAALALRSDTTEEGAPSVVPVLAPARIGDGPMGGKPVPLAQWRYVEQGDQSAKHLRSGAFTGRAVTVPYSPNASAVSGPGAQAGYEGAVGWFAREIVVPEAGRYALTCGSAHYAATVYLDGRPIRRHVGAYQPFVASATLAKGRHTVSVRVDWRDPAGQAEAGDARGWFNFGGLNGAVTLARVGPTELGALNLRTQLATKNGALVRVSVRVSNRGRTRRIRPEGSLVRGGTRIRLNFGSVVVPANGSRRVAATVRIREVALWSPETPRRYALTVRVPGEAALRRPVGLRELRFDGGRLRLNGRPLTLRGAGLPADAEGHGDALTLQDEARNVAELKAVGANATRSQLPLSDSMLDRLDAAGILVWQEIGPWEPAGAFRQPSIARAEDRALRTAEREQPHASVVAWTLTNEAAGGGRPEQQDYVVRTARVLHALDPGRPVAADLWGRHLPRASSPMLEAVDALGVTDYTGWYEDTELPLAAQDAKVLGRLANLRAMFPDKPLVVSEFGAVGTPRVPERAFGGERFQADLLARRARLLDAAPGVSGALVWLLRDQALRPDFRGGSVLDAHPGLPLAPGLNEKGLFDAAGRPKPALAAVRSAFAAAQR